MSILVLTNLFVCIKTPIQYQQQNLWVSGYLQTIHRDAVVGHLRPTTIFMGHGTYFMSHKYCCRTPMSHNDRAGVAV